MDAMKTRCYIYTRVSTANQVDGYSLDAQRERILAYAKYQEMEVVGEYSDEGRSGKNILNRPDFQRMLDNIMNKREVSYVLVFKLSRFGRNAADVLSSLQQMQDYGVNLICVEDGIDSSKDAGKLMISVLSAVAEIERENILVQTMEGRRQKAREGKWNGGQAPYGYQLKDGVLVINEEEAPAIRAMFEEFVRTPFGAGSVAKFLNENFEKHLRKNGKLDEFTLSFVKKALDNPVYYGKIAYGRRTNVKDNNGERNTYHRQQQETYLLFDGQHEAIVSEELWMKAHAKRTETGVRTEKKYSLEHANVLSTIARCPVCGGPLYGAVSRKWKKGDVVQLHFDMPVRTVKANGHVADDRGRIAVERGPLVYCAEGADNAGFNIFNFLMPRQPRFTIADRQIAGKRDVTFNVTAITVNGQAVDTNDQGQVVTKDATLTMVPYYAWNHRGPGLMEVWMPQSISALGNY